MFINLLILLLNFPSREILHELLPSASMEEPVIVDTVLNPSRMPDSNRLVLLRERNGWCPYSERVWLALESKGLDYDTFLIDNMGARPTWYGGTTPQIRWEDNSQQSESMDIVYSMEERYGPGSMPLFGPESNFEEVKALVDCFKSIFPRNTRPSSRAAFLFYSSGQPVFKSEFESTLGKTDELLGKHSDGPFFLGKSFTAADIAWAPFLERYAAQLPVLHRGLVVRDPQMYPNLANWFAAMHRLPFYSAKVAGDPESWMKVLRMQGYGNAGNVPDTIEASEAGYSLQSRTDDDEIFAKYADGKPFIAATPAGEAAARVLRNIDDIKRDVLKKKIKLPEDYSVECYLRGLVAALLLSGSNSDVNLGTLTYSELVSEPGVKCLANYLKDRICVPRDMGLLAAKSIYRLAENCH